jgi:hypothetical protein
MRALGTTGERKGRKKRVRERRICSAGSSPRRRGRSPWAPPLWVLLTAREKREEVNMP